MEIMNMKIKLMATLWENTYRVAIEDGQQQYLATVRVVVNTPLPEDVLPPNAPQVEPQLLALVEDFNFDGEKEIVISGDNGIYIYDRKTGKEKKFFEKEKGGGYAKTGSQNYIFTYRGEYKKDEKEKTITITGACGAGCGVEEIYRFESPETMKLVKKCEWDY